MTVLSSNAIPATSSILLLLNVCSKSIRKVRSGVDPCFICRSFETALVCASWSMKLSQKFLQTSFHAAGTLCGILSFHSIFPLLLLSHLAVISLVVLMSLRKYNTFSESVEKRCG